MTNADTEPDVDALLAEGGRRTALTLVYELGGLDTAAAERTFVNACLLACEIDPERTVFVAGDAALEERVLLPTATPTARSTVAREMIRVGDRYRDATLELHRDGVVRPRSDLPWLLRARDALLDVVDALPWTAGGSR